MNCEFIFFEYDSDSQPHNKMHHSHAVLLVNFILKNVEPSYFGIYKRFLYVIAPVSAGDCALLARLRLAKIMPVKRLPLMVLKFID